MTDEDSYINPKALLRDMQSSLGLPEGDEYMTDLLYVMSITSLLNIGEHDLLEPGVNVLNSAGDLCTWWLTVNAVIKQFDLQATASDEHRKGFEEIAIGAESVALTLRLVRKAEKLSKSDDVSMSEVLSYSFIAGCAWVTTLLTAELAKIQKGLAIGRDQGNLAKQLQAATKHAKIIRAVEDLYRNGVGFQMSYKQITTYLVDEKKVSGYTWNQTRKLVEKCGPPLKKKHAKSAPGLDSG